MKKAIDITVTILLILYFMVLIAVLILKYPTGMLDQTFIDIFNGKEIIRLEPQLVPFRTINFYVSHVQAVTDWFFKNLFCNLIMFMPLGFLVPIKLDCKNNKTEKKNKIKIPRVFKILLLGTLISIAVELIQYATALGQMDIDDVILNAVGTYLGYVCYMILSLGRKLINKINSK